MITYKIKIKEIKLIKNKTKNPISIKEIQKQYTGCFHKLYANSDELENEEFIDKLIKNNCFLDTYIVGCCVIDEVKTKLKQTEINLEQQKLECLKSIEKFDNSYHKYKTQNKIKELEIKEEKNIVFGGKANLGTYTHHLNLANKAKNEEEKQKQLSLAQENLDKFHKQRLLPYRCIGEYPQKSNRKFQFNLDNLIIYFKPNKNIKFELKLYANKKLKKQLSKLQEYVGKIPITVSLTEEYICFSYDEINLTNYKFNKSKCREEQKATEDKEEKKQIYIKHKKEQEARMLDGKKKNRYISIDKNPLYIGVSIIDKIDKDNFQVVDKWCYDLSKLGNKLNLSSNRPKQIYQNNKREFELKECYVDLFKKAKHYKVAYFVDEDLDFKDSKKLNTEATRQTKNLWKRELQEHLINKNCNLAGIQHIKVNPAFSSFVGNLCHNYFDPINASIEIGRRGMSKFGKGSSLYPPIDRIDQDNLKELNKLDSMYDLDKNILKGWKELWKFFKNTKLRYRKPSKDGSDLWLLSRKSKIRLVA